MKTKITGSTYLLALLSFFVTATVHADDRSDVEAVINKYIDTETVDGLHEQAKLMSKDRTYISGGIRYSNNDKSMALQIALGEAMNNVYSDRKRITTVEDIEIRLNGDAAIASFYRVVNTIRGADQIRAGQNATLHTKRYPWPYSRLTGRGRSCTHISLQPSELILPCP